MTIDHLLDSMWRAFWQAALLFLLVVVFVRLTPGVRSSIRCLAYRLVCLNLLLAFAVAPLIPLELLPPEEISSGPATLQVDSERMASAAGVLLKASESPLSVGVSSTETLRHQQGKKFGTSRRLPVKSARPIPHESWGSWQLCLVLFRIGGVLW